MKSGRKVKAAKGGYGSPAFGLRSVDKELVTDEREAAVAVRIRELREAGKSLRQIAGQLNAQGLKPKRGGVWHSMTVSRVLERKAAA